MEAQSEYVHVASTFFCTSGADSYAQSVLVNEMSAPELGRKLIKSALLVGHTERDATRQKGRKFGFFATSGSLLASLNLHAW